MHPTGEKAEEGPEKVKVLTRHIGHLEDGTNPTVDRVSMHNSWQTIEL